MSGFRVDPDALADHARRIGELAARMRSATTAARPLDLGAYGVVGQVFTLSAVAAVDTGVAAVGGLGRRTDELADGVGAAAEAYRAADRAQAARLRGSGA